MIPENRPTQNQLNSYKNGDKLWIVWSGGNKGTYIVRECNGSNWAFAAHLLEYKEKKYREKIIMHSLLDMSDVSIWECKKIAY